METGIDQLFLAVHPRMGGEQMYARLLPAFSSGSSPHGRGTVCRRPGYRPPLRFIPAWAGNRFSMASRRARCAVHPRMGGEQSTWTCCALIWRGSSPHGRGTAPPEGLPAGDTRFIPAWAGNRFQPLPVSSSETVHPRMGGEQGDVRPERKEPFGSSPHGRGTVRKNLLCLPVHRFIPAWAGNRGLPGCPVTREAVHPRMGGEQSPGPAVSWLPFGSSPHGRGTVAREFIDYCADRFIPAWAGNSRSMQGGCGVVKVHPRMGGEQLSFDPFPKSRAGSSPHGRGTA